MYLEKVQKLDPHHMQELMLWNTYIQDDNGGGGDAGDGDAYDNGGGGDAGDGDAYDNGGGGDAGDGDAYDNGGGGDE